MTVMSLAPVGQGEVGVVWTMKDGVQNPGKVFSIGQIYERIWKEEAVSGDNTVAVHIRHIREKIEINPKDPRYLKVVWGVGYKIDRE